MILPVPGVEANTVASRSSVFGIGRRKTRPAQVPQCSCQQPRACRSAACCCAAAAEREVCASGRRRSGQLSALPKNRSASDHAMGRSKHGALRGYCLLDQFRSCLRDHLLPHRIGLLLGIFLLSRFTQRSDLFRRAHQALRNAQEAGTLTGSEPRSHRHRGRSDRPVLLQSARLRNDPSPSHPQAVERVPGATDTSR